MTGPSEPAADRRLGRVLLGAMVFALFAPIGLVVLPLAGLLLLSASDTRGRLLLLVASTLGIGWLMGVGELPDQTVRALALMGAVSFGVLTASTGLSTLHRGLVATVVAFLSVGVGYAALGVSLSELVWTVEHRVGMAARVVSDGMWTAAENNGSIPPTTAAVLRQTEDLLQAMAHFVATNVGAVFAIELLIGFAIATAIYRKASRNPRGPALGRLRDFAFTEHIGWMAVLGLVGIMLPKVAVVKAAAGNLVLLTAALYALRGAAVVTFIGNAAGGGVLMVVMLTLATVFMLPLVVGGAIVVGILDTGLNIRKRWANPPARG